jgi:transposase-like protein
MVVGELESGSTLAALRRKYGIKGATTIQGWIRAYGKHHLLNKTVRIETMTEGDRLKQLEAENKQLKIKLAETYLAKDCLEELVSMANEIYNTDLKKNFGAPSPKNWKPGTA